MADPSTPLKNFLGKPIEICIVCLGVDMQALSFTR